MGGENASETREAELVRLTAELAGAHARLDAAFRTDPPGAVARGDRLSLYLAEAQKVLDILNRIKQVESETGR
ncbi:MAG TPA: hypothetical protein VHU23_16005 [Rhizomicrobium sp.]|jgi:hypothetical protein|nr:hypothetical protein [Rhizomicrobium sp.]